MRKIIAFALLTFTAYGIDAQIKIGLNGGLYNTYVINKTINSDDNLIETKTTLQPMYGIGAVIMLGEKLGISTGLNVLNYKQILEGEYIQNVGPAEISSDYRLELELDYTSIPIYIRSKTPWGMYVESGVQLNFKNSAKETLDFLNEDGSVSFSNGEINVSDDFSDFVLALGFGVGFDIGISEKLFLNTGIDISYSLNDAGINYSEEDLIQNAVGAYSLASHLGIIENGPTAADLGDYGYESTTNANAGLKISLFYKL